MGGNDPMEAIRAHWRRRAQMRAIEVPEWGMTIHVRSPNMAELAEIGRVNEEDGDHAAAVRAIVLLARDAEGRPIFRRGHEAELMREADPAVLLRLSGEILRPPAAAAEDAAKN